MDVTTAKAWESLSKFENYDYVWNLIQKIDPKKENLPVDKKSNHIIRDINAHFTQGREYFRNAEQAALITKPLLLYYGVLALARGSILLLNADNANFTRAFGHGLCLQDSNLMQEENATKNEDAVQTKNEDAVQNEDSIPNLLDVGIKRAKKSDKKNQEKKSGTFEEFVDCMGNNNNFFVEVNPEIFPISFHKAVAKNLKFLHFSVNFPETNFLKKGDYSITLNDLLSRDSRLYYIYNSTLDYRKNRNSNCFLTQLDISKENSNNYSLIYYLDVEFRNESVSLTDAFNSSESYIKLLKTSLLNSAKYDEIVTDEEGNPKILLGNNLFNNDNLPPLHTVQTLDINSYPIERNEYKQRYKQFFIINFNGNDSFSLLHITYMTAYLLGMVARYYPYKWTSLLRGEKGNFGQPAILQAIQNIERDFPVLINSALEAKRLEKINKRKNKKSPTVGYC